MRTWAVAKGGAKFEVIFDEGNTGDNDPWFQKALVFGGQLVLFVDPATGKSMAHVEPMTVEDRSKSKTHVSRASWFLQQKRRRVDE